MTFVFLAGSALFIMAISFGGTLYSWHSAAEIAFWTLSGVFLLVFVVLLKFHPGVSKEHQLWPSHFLRMPVVMNIQLQIFLSGGIILVSQFRRDASDIDLLWTIIYYIPLYFQFIRVSKVTDT